MTTAQFIAAASATGAEGEPAAYFRREFDVTEQPVCATLRVSALGLVEPHLNGRTVGDEVFAPGWTSYRHRLAVSVHDVTSGITVGRNAVGAVVGEGWAVGRLASGRRVFADRSALLLELELEYADRTELIVSDGTFHVGTGGTRENSIYDGESFDARLEPAGWDAAGFDDSGWEAVAIDDGPKEALFDRVAEPIRRIEERTPVAIRRTPSGRTVVDFGQNLSGWVRLTVDGPAGRTVTLRHCELLTPDGEPEFEPNRTARATDRYTLRGGGPETWEPRFTYHGFRYVEVEGWPGELHADALRAVVVHSDMRRTGWFETSDPLLNSLHANTVWSMRGNFVGVPTDCPQRDERLGWTGDINAFAPTAAFLYDVRGVLGSWLRDLAAEQQATGGVPWVVPNVMLHRSPPTALWGDVAVSLPWTLYQEYGDPKILEDAYDSMALFVRQVESLLDADGLWSSGFQFGDWLDPDAPAHNPAAGKADRSLVATAYFCRVARQMADTAAVLQRHEDAGYFGDLADRVRAAFRDEYLTPTGRIADESATAYALAITFDLVDGRQLTKAGDRLARLVTAAGHRISTGFAGTPHITHALSRSGHIDQAYLLLMQKECPSFLYPVTMGATTTWERWDAVLPDGTLNSTGMTSLNHYAFGAVADWLHRVVGGIEPAEPGYRRLRIAPRPGGGLTWARTAHDTVQGRVEVQWRIDGRTLTLDVTTPEGTTADIVLPLHPEHATAEVSAGSHSWQYEISADCGARPKLTMDTPLSEIARHPHVLADVAAVFRKHLPGIPVDPTDPSVGGTNLTTALQFIPGASSEFEADLRQIFAGEEGH
ncbi:family 78 glycoside hydrolase catalytic domain [Streptomyces longisporoflavus]|uniref:alpha-L-rhamnosidase n=1 Tax=Streptomyces longisporoflavus TaxID=28044 RepID=A0ABW7R1P4_9ACTN